MSALPKRDLRVDALPEKLRTPDLVVVGIGESGEESGVTRHQTDEHLNFQTHGIGMLASCVAGFYLIKVATILCEPLQVFGAVVFTVTMIGVYTCSTLSHGPFSPEWRERFRTCDQISIFCFIAGGFTPFALTHLRSPWGYALLAATWALAFIGTGLKLYVTKTEMVSVWFYAIQGWLPSLALFKVAFILPLAGTMWIAIGGLAYTAGIYFLMNDHKAPWYHAVWHALVIIGTSCHFAVVLCYVLPWN